MYPEEPNGQGRRGDPRPTAVAGARRPPPPYTRPPPYARPPPPYRRPTSEELLFDDIFREKAVALRSIMIDFLNVQPYSKFEAEFQNFLSRLRRLTAEGQRAAAAAAALSDAAASAAASTAAVAAANDLTVVSADGVRTAAYTATTTRPAGNLSKPVYNRIESMQPPYVFELSCAWPKDKERRTAAVLVDQPGTSASAGASTSGVSITASRIYGDPAASSGSGLSARRPRFTRPTESIEKNLSKWSVEVMTLDVDCPVAVMKLNGFLLAGDKVTVLEETHDAGLIECRVDVSLVKTTHGFYRLNGPVTGAFSDDFRQACLETNGFPKNWRQFLIQNTNVEETNEDTSNANNSVTRSGACFKSAAQKSNEKGKLTKQNLAKHKVVMQQLSQASASKTLEQLSVCKTPSQFLKYQFHRKLVKACKIVSNHFK